MSKLTGFFSAVDEAAKALKRGKGTGKEFMTEVVKTKGVKPTEIKERGLHKLEELPKMTKEEFIKELEKRPAAKIEEKVLKDQGEKFSELERMAEREYGEPFEDLHPDIQDQIEQEFDAAAAQYGEYKLPGGENYREILLKMPAMSDKETERLMSLEAKYRRMSQPSQWVFEESAEGKEMKALKDKSQQSAYYSSHWGKDEPNVLAHLRVQDRVGPNGEKVLHVEEIQSDWHQAGRKKGYRSQDAINAYADYEKALPERTLNKITEMFIEAGTEPERARQLAEKQLKTVLSMSRERNLGPSNMAAILGEEKEMNKLWDAARAEKDKVPEAPFKKNWHELAMKRVLNYAAENGYDKVAITPGAEQASRYNLAKQVEQITASQEDGKFRIFARDLQGKNHDMGAFEPEKLSEVVGKDLAGKIAAQDKPYDIYQGVDLEVGGEGMKGFYDKMLPDYLNTYGKKYGVQVEPIDIVTHPEKSTPQVSAPGIDYFPEPVVEPAQKKQVHGFQITPQMREEITGKGMPLYQQIGIPAGGAAAGAEALEGQEDQGFKAGGKAKHHPDSPEAKGSIAPKGDDEGPMTSMPEMPPVAQPPMEQGYAMGGAVTAPAGTEYDTEPDMEDGGRVIQGSAFKKGGKVKKRGQVKFASNPDTMLLELMSRS
jgi:hypothetical protein